MGDYLFLEAERAAIAPCLLDPDAAGLLNR